MNLAGRNLPKDKARSEGSHSLAQASQMSARGEGYPPRV